MNEELLSASAAKKTKLAFVLSRILDTPFWAIFNMLPFILYKDLHATPFQLTVIIALKPLSSIFSMYWSALVDKRRDRIIPNIIWSNILRHLPFFFFPFVDNIWYFIAAFGFHMMLSRGAQPAWMELLKINIPGVTREKVFAYGSAFGYVGDAALPFVLGWILDGYFEAWRFVFPIAALTSLIAIAWQKTIPIPIEATYSQNKSSPLKQLTKPWKEAKTLLENRPDFTKFQIAFMLGGAGLMVIQPALPIYFVDVLNLTYFNYAFALTTCKGIGFALATPFWANWMNKVNIYRFTSIVTILASLFPLLILLSPYQTPWLYIGYLGYGVMQAGSTLSWNLSGPIFSKEEDSSLFTSVNVVTVGIRGAVAPAMGWALCSYTSSTYALLFGSLLCILATERLVNYSKGSLREAKA